MRISDWSSDVCSSDLIWCRRIEGDWASALNRDILVPRPAGRFFFARLLGVDGEKLHLLPLGAGQRQQVVSNPPWAAVAELGRASCRERVCQDVWIWAGAFSLKKQT